VWGYTPRRIAGFLGYATRRERLEKAERLALDASAARGKESDLKKLIREMGKD
jgi:hypothetical protein